MTHNRFILWVAATLLILTTACTETDMLKADLPQEPSKPHTYRLSIDMPVPSHYGQTTRANTEWEDGSQVEFKFYISGTNGTYNTVSGLAAYSATKKEWSLVPEGDFPSDRTMTDCEVRYYQSPAGSDNNFLTAVYFGTTTYSIDGNLILCNSISLKPTNWRLRFQGERDAQIQLSSPDLVYRLGGMVDEDDYLSDNTLTLTVSSDGYTPYIYGTFKNETGDNSITIETGGQKYSRTISGTVLKPGETGYIVIPTESNYQSEGWTIVDDSQPVGPPDGVEAVDLGLPSGLLWANMNVGATSPEDYGDYFAWGETEPKGTYSWGTYKYCNGSYDTMTKYCMWYRVGTVDNKAVLEAADDAATVNWGNEWRMPTSYEFRELLDNTMSERTTQNGVNGRKFTSKVNGNSIFLPAAGLLADDTFGTRDNVGTYWSALLETFSTWSSYCAVILRFGESLTSTSNEDRKSGLSVRAVQGESIPPEHVEFPDGIEAVDLGLPSGVKWANMNVGASKPEEYGLFFAWGETTGYTSDTNDGRSFNWASFKWMTDGKSSWHWVNKYQVADGQTDGCWYSSGQFVGDGLSTLLPEDDAATANWGANWRIPTIDEYRELLNNTESEWTTQNGVNGRKFTSKVNGNSIFLPAAGYRFDASLGYQGASGYYWSASLYTSSSGNARYLYFDSGSASTSLNDRCYGRSVRAVLRN